MPRLNTGQELFKHLDSLSVFRVVSGGGSTTAAGAITAGATTLNFASTTSFTAADPLILSGASATELLVIGAAVTPTTAVPITRPAAAANPIGTQILEAVETVLGHVQQGGIQLSGQAPLTAIYSALRQSPLAYIRGYGEMQASFGLLGFNIPNLMTAFGITEAEGGTGTTADPYRGFLGGGNIGSQGIQVFRATGTRFDGATIIADFCNAFVEPQGAISLARAAEAPIPVNMRFSDLIVRQFS